MDAAKIREYEQDALFTERQGTGATAWSGVLELAPELAVFLRGDDAVADPERLPAIILEIPRNEFRTDRGRKAVLPGAPDAFCDRAYVFFHDAREMGHQCRTERALRQSVGDQIERYFTEGAGSCEEAGKRIYRGYGEGGAQYASTDKFMRRTVSGDVPPQHKKPVSDYLQRVLDSMADLSRNPAKAPEVEKSGGIYEIVKPSR